MSGKRAKKTKGKRGAVMALLFAFFLGQLLVGGFHLAGLLKEYAAGQETYEKLIEQVRSDPTPAQPGATPPPWPQIDFAALAEINPDIVGWIVIEGTDINYPIVQGEDNKRYLNYLFTGEKNRAGCVFLDCENAADFSDPNSVVYGHYLNDGTMFSPLLQYKKQEYFDAHPTGWLVTPEGGYKISFFSGFVSSVRGKAWDKTPSGAWPEEMLEKSRFSGGPIPQPGDRFLTLSTCSYEFNNARFILLGILEKRS